MPWSGCSGRAIFSGKITSTPSPRTSCRWSAIRHSGGAVHSRRAGLRPGCRRVLGPRDRSEGAVLRRFRDREFFRAGVRAILGLSGGLEGFAAELSDLGEALIQAADRITRDELAAILPRRTDGQPAPTVLVALGKFGGRELGFGSDLEMMLVYDDRDLTPIDGTTGAGASFDRVVTLLRHVLWTSHGGTFEIDFRLRPYGRGGPPATALSAFADYYRAGGPAWSYERQALIKLRSVAGDPALGARSKRSATGSSSDPSRSTWKAAAGSAGSRSSSSSGPGRSTRSTARGPWSTSNTSSRPSRSCTGANDPALWTPNTSRAIAALEASGHLTPECAEKLRSGYRFFRALIDALRVVHGHAKDLTVPPADSDEFLRLARRLHQPDPDRLQADLDRMLDAVRGLWDDAERLLPAPVDRPHVPGPRSGSAATPDQAGFDRLRPRFFVSLAPSTSSQNSSLGIPAPA